MFAVCRRCPGRQLTSDSLFFGFAYVCRYLSCSESLLTNGLLSWKGIV